MAGTELGCRSLFRVENDSDITTKVHQQLYAWCKNPRKNWDADKLSGPGVAEVAPGVTASLVRDDRQDGSTIERWRFHQDEGHGVWITQLTTLVDRNDDGWVWTDVLRPSGADASVPRLVSNILEVADGLDGRHRLTAEPFRAHIDDVDYLYDALLDPQRRGYLFLAGADDNVTVPLPEWADFVAKLLSRTRGIASAYALDAETTLALNSRLPESHRLRPWSIRTYLPHPELNDPRDSTRHRMLTTARIIDDSQYRLRDLLGRSACRHSTTFALPSELIRIDRRLRELLDETIVDRVVVTTQVPQASSETPREVAEPPLIDTPPVDTAGPAPDRASSGILDTLRTVVRSVIGTAEVTTEAVSRLGQLASEALRQQDSVRLVRSRIQTIESERSALEDQNTELTRTVDDGLIDLAEALSDLDTANRELRHLRGELARVGRDQADWQPPENSLDMPPGSFQELLERLDELVFVEFTGQEKYALELDEKNPLDSWARKTWNALRALNDYCRVRTSSEFTGSVDDYIIQTPPGCVSIPPNSHARDETGATENHKQYGKARTFPVPVAVDAGGTLFMGAHVKIAKFGSISPRMHYYNDATGTGKIYVGYIGPHLPNFRTN
ncbi:hypothetical protein GIY30_16690 [Gordonia sp. HNM0687]|uniref:Uncharacterized protein n=1 Tax=Gordonia mangrovi TaxID=2665643 RepID=A0A6L7GST2_9ACTN|nr:hypothetical protein [Gordonia mangrovi]MXP22976.1 hypothetical protein [Gordonia mangrovi]UVF77272.1 hypothetical protein NWF22_18505 [Gordonia mangrovi]